MFNIRVGLKPHRNVSVLLPRRAAAVVSPDRRAYLRARLGLGPLAVYRTVMAAFEMTGVPRSFDFDSIRIAFPSRQ